MFIEFDIQIALRIAFFILVSSKAFCAENRSENNFPNWRLNFPKGSATGMFLAVAIPLALPRNSAYLAFNWEVSYPLPSNQSEFTFPPIIGEKMSRKNIYEALEVKLESQGYSGRSCLLRMICESSSTELDINGVLGDIVKILLKPSTSQNPDLPLEYGTAEQFGEDNGNCTRYNENCIVSFLDFVSWLT